MSSLIINAMIVRTFIFSLLGQLIACQYQLQPTKPAACQNGDEASKASEQEVSDLFFKSYGPWQRPKINASETLVVNITFVISSIRDVRERDGVVIVAGYLSLRWFDEFRTWSESFPYNCADCVVLPADQIWVPDVAQMNADGRYELLGKSMEKVRIYSNGYTIFSPGGTFQIFCKFDMSLFPFDTQKCALSVESWRYTRQLMMFQFGSSITMKYWIENEQWTLIDTWQEMSDSSYLDPWNSFDHADFHIVLKRKSEYYVMNMLVPSSIISLAHLAAFALPLGTDEKLGISFTTLLTYAVFQLMVMDSMPKSSRHIPLLSIFIDFQMAFIALSMLAEAACLLILAKIDETLPYQSRQWVPRCLMTASIAMGRLLFISPPSQAPARQQETIVRRQPVEIPPTSAPRPTQPPDSIHFGQERPVDVTAVRTTRAASEETIDSIRRRSQHSINNVNNNEQQNNAEPSLNMRQLQWNFVARVIDRSVAIFYFVSIVITPVLIFTVNSKE